MRGDKCHPGRGKRVKILLLPNNVGKKSVNEAGPQQGHNTDIKLFYSYLIACKYCRGPPRRTSPYYLKLDKNFENYCALTFYSYHSHLSFTFLIYKSVYA